MNEELDQFTADKLQELVQCCIYSGKSTESYVETRVRLFKAIIKKSSQSIPADPDSNVNEMRRVHLQCLVWIRCMTSCIPGYNVLLHGWEMKNDVLAPVFFLGNQYPH